VINGIIGGMGSGKTLVMTKLLYDECQAKKNVFTNYDLNFKHEIISQDDILNYSDSKTELFNCAIGLDEIYLYIDSRQSGTKRNRIYSYFMLQTNKRDVNLYYTAQNWHTVEKRFRDNTACIYSVVPMIRKPDGELVPRIDFSNRLVPKKLHDSFYIGVTKIMRVSIGVTQQIFTKKYLLKASDMFGLYDTKQIIHIEKAINGQGHKARGVPAINQAKAKK